MFWLFAAVVLFLLVISPGFRLLALMGGILGILIAALGLGYYFLFIRPESERAEEQEREREKDAMLSALVKAASEASIPIEAVETTDLTIRDRPSRIDSLVQAHRALSFDTHLDQSRRKFFRYSTGIFPDTLELNGRIRNTSPRFNLFETHFLVRMLDCDAHGACESIAETRPIFSQLVPTGQARELFIPLEFKTSLNFRSGASWSIAVTKTVGYISPDVIDSELREEEEEFENLPESP